LSNDKRPREQEHGERIEDDEDERDEVEANRELHPRFADRVGAAFVAFELGGKWATRAEDARGDERHHRERHDHAEIDDDWQVAGH
jgi:hypothetical protein